MRFVRFSRALAAVLVAIVATAPPAGAQDDADPIDLNDLDLYWEVMEHVVEELTYFEVLGRVSDPVPELVDGLPERLGIGPAPTSVYEDQLRRLEGIEGPELLARFVAQEAPTSESVRTVLVNSGAGSVDAGIYLQAYDDAVWQWWQEGGRDYGLIAAVLGESWVPGWWTDAELAPVLVPVDPGDVAAPVDDVVDPGPAEPVASPADDTVADSTAPEPAPTLDRGAAPVEPPSPDDRGSTVPIAVGVGAGLVLALSAAMVLRRRDPATDAEVVLEAGRRFLAADSVDALGAEIADTARRFSDAAGTMFLTDRGSWGSGSAPVVDDHLLEQVRATGRTVRRGSDAVVAVVSDGLVVGLIAVTGAGSSVEVVEQLAPLAGQGLANVIDRDATEQLAFVDALTEVPNRRRFDLDLSRHARLAAGDGFPVAVAMIDVDHFKTYNDTNGHHEGDEALRAVARLISASLRAEDTVYRFGGEEFVALLPGADVEAAHRVAERIRRAVESHDFAGGPGQPGGKVTVSIGVSTSPPPDGRVMLEAADAALYRAKDRGRNQVVLAGPD
ncbi:MAG: GGDEF domain-containing protein [Actinomycetota bacterium]